MNCRASTAWGELIRASFISASYQSEPQVRKIFQVLVAEGGDVGEDHPELLLVEVGGAFRPFEELGVPLPGRVRLPGPRPGEQVPVVVHHAGGVVPGQPPRSALPIRKGTSTPGMKSSIGNRPALR